MTLMMVGGQQKRLEALRRAWEAQGGTRATLRRARKEQKTLFPEWRDSYSTQYERAEVTLARMEAEHLAGRSGGKPTGPRATKAIRKEADGWYAGGAGPFPTRDAARRAKKTLREEP